MTPNFENIVPLTTEQQLQRVLAPDSMVPFTFRLSGPVDREILRQAFGAVVDRHQPLRMRLVEAEDGSIQQGFVPPGIPFELSCSMVSAEAFPKWEQGFLTTTIDIFSESPVRAELVDVDDGRQVLMVMLHHSATDAMAGPTFVEEIWWAYAALAADFPLSSILAPLRHTFADTVLRQLAAGATLTSGQFEFWRTAMRDGRSAALPTRQVEPASTENPGRTDGPTVFDHHEEFFRLDHTMTTALAERARSARVPQLAAVIAGLSLGISRHLGERAPIFGYITPGREGPGMAKMIAFFVRLLFLRISVDEERPLQEFLEDATRSWSDAEQHARPPYSPVRMLTALAEAGALEPTAISPEGGGIIVNYVNAGMPLDVFGACPAPRPEGLTVEAEQGRPEGAEVGDNVFVNVGVQGDELVFAAWYDARLFQHDDVRSLFEQLRQVFTSICSADLSMPLRAL